MEWIAEFFNNIQEFAQDVWDWLYIGIYYFFKALLVTATKAMIYAYLEGLLICMDVAYTVVQELLEDTGVIAEVRNAYNAIPADVRGYLAFFNVPQGLTLIFTAIPTRLAMKFVPIFGR